MARAATAGELAKFRASGQWSELYLAIEQPANIFACRVNQSFTTTDKVASVTYDTVTTGAYTDVLVGMTVKIGTAAGLDDLGQCRVRQLPTATVLYLGETSEIAWTDNLYITVINEFGLWAKHLTLDGNTPRMDYDVEYSDQHAYCDPIPVLGPDAVLWLTGATVVFSPTAANSWVLGSTIAEYSWAAPGASATANLTTATPTITYNAAGQYRVSCTVTAVNGKSFTGYRKVFIFTAASLPIIPVLESCTGDWESGGWSYSVTVYQSAGLSTIRDRAKCILFAKDHYGTSTPSIGPITGYENIICSGWIDGESIDYDSQSGTVKFSVHGPAFWLAKIPGFATGVKNDDAAPEGWLFFEDLTVDAGLWHFLHWRSTATAIMDIYVTGDTRPISATEAPAGSLWAQLEAIAYQTILAKPVCDRYGRLYAQIDTQFTDLASRSTIPIVQAIAAGDWRGDDGIQIERRTVSDVAILEISGVSYDGTTATPIISRAPGNVYRRFGRNEAIDRLLFVDQADANTRSGMILARMNNPYPSVALPLAQSNRLIDICPLQYVTLSIASTDTPRGITWTNQKLIPRRVSFSHDEGVLLTDLECEAETTGEGQPVGITVTPPQPPQTNLPPVNPIDPEAPFVPPDNTWFPPWTPFPEPLDNCMNNTTAPGNGPFSLSFDRNVIYPGETAYAHYPCGVRVMGSQYQTRIYLDHFVYVGDVFSGMTVYAINESLQNILSADTITNSYAEFTPAQGTPVAGFAVALSGTGSGLYKPTGSSLASGAVNVMANPTYTVSGLNPANVYCVQSSGYWNGQSGHAGFDSKSLGSVTGGTIVAGEAAPLETPVRPRYYLYPSAGGVITIHFTDAPTGDNINHDFTYYVYLAIPAGYLMINSAPLYNICSVTA